MTTLTHRFQARELLPARRFVVAGVATLVMYLLGVGIGALAGVTTAVGEVSPAGAGPSAGAILVNNIGVLAWLAVGLISAGVVSLAILMFNGMLLGWLVGKMALAGSLDSIVTGVLPHFVPEMAAYVVSASASISLGLDLAGRLLRRDRPTALRWNTWFTAQGLALVLLAVGALIERYVSHV